jgi:peroxiredoxin Q/BCP
VVGASLDTVEDQRAFAGKYDLPFAMLSDTERTLARAYGVLGPGFTSRVTFLIDREGVVRKVWPRVSPATHAAEVIEALRSL